MLTQAQGLVQYIFFMVNEPGSSDLQPEFGGLQSLWVCVNTKNRDCLFYYLFRPTCL